MKVDAPVGEEAFDDLQPSEEPPIGAQSRSCSTDTRLNPGKDLAAVLRALKTSEVMLHRWRTGCRRAAVVAAK